EQRHDPLLRHFVGCYRRVLCCGGLGNHSHCPLRRPAAHQRRYSRGRHGTGPHDLATSPGRVHRDVDRPQGSFPGTATLIEGADYASFTYSVAAPEGTFAVGGECSIKDGVEVCVAAEDGEDGTATVTNTDTATPFGLQIAATGAPAGGASPTSAPSGGANSGSTPAASGTASVQSGSAVRTSASSIGALAGLLFAYHLL
ncbi:hypothetical protein B0H13DRAFT_2123586, partial [Mycena leptocephala]